MLFYKKCNIVLARVIVGSIPSQDTRLGCRFIPSLGASKCNTQPCFKFIYFIFYCCSNTVISFPPTLFFSLPHPGVNGMIPGPFTDSQSECLWRQPTDASHTSMFLSLTSSLFSSLSKKGNGKYPWVSIKKKGKSVI